MQISLNATLTGGRAGWPELARVAAKAGYPAVDVAAARAVEQGTDATLAVLHGSGLKAGVLDLPVQFRNDDATFRQDLKRLDVAARLAVAVECPRMTTWIMSSSETPKTELRKVYRQRFQACAEILAERGVRLGLEFLGPLHLRKRFPYEFIWRMDEMLEFAKECGPNAGLLVDSWHWHHAGATVADIVSAGKARIVHVQVNDSADLAPDKVLDSERLMPGEGVIDLHAFFGALKKIGYSDAVSPEVFGRGLKNIPMEEGARMGLESTRAVMTKAGVPT